MPQVASIGCLKLQVSFCKRATNYRALLGKMTYKDKASSVSSSPCRSLFILTTFFSSVCLFQVSQVKVYVRVCCLALSNYTFEFIRASHKRAPHVIDSIFFTFPFSHCVLTAHIYLGNCKIIHTPFIFLEGDSNGCSWRPFGACVRGLKLDHVPSFVRVTVTGDNIFVA